MARFLIGREKCTVCGAKMAPYMGSRGVAGFGRFVCHQCKSNQALLENLEEAQEDRAKAARKEVDKARKKEEKRAKRAERRAMLEEFGAAKRAEKERKRSGVAADPGSPAASVQQQESSPTHALTPPAPTSTGWLDDPFGRHQYRYFDGSEWTENVSDEGIQTTDAPLPSPPKTESREQYLKRINSTNSRRGSL